MIKKHLYLAVIYESLLTLSFGNLFLVLLFELPFPYRDLCFVFWTKVRTYGFDLHRVPSCMGTVTWNWLHCPLAIERWPPSPAAAGGLGYIGSGGVMRRNVRGHHSSSCLTTLMVWCAGGRAGSELHWQIYRNSTIYLQGQYFCNKEHVSVKPQIKSVCSHFPTYRILSPT